MSKKDYELIATTVKHMELGDSTQVYIATMLAEAFAMDNTRFDKTRFVKASVDANLSPLYIAEVQSSSQARVDRLKEALNA